MKGGNDDTYGVVALKTAEHCQLKNSHCSRCSPRELKSQSCDNGFVSSRELSSGPKKAFFFASTRFSRLISRLQQLSKPHPVHGLPPSKMCTIKQVVFSCKHKFNNGTVPCQTKKNGAISCNTSSYDYTNRNKLCPRCQKLEDERRENKDKSCRRYRRKTPAKTTK